MIQSPALSPLSMVPAAGDLPLPTGTGGAEMADFGALLAITAGQAATLPADDTTPEALPPAAIAAAPEPAMPGKILPGTLPLAVPVMEPEKLPAPADLPPVTPLPLAKIAVPVMRAAGKARPAAEPASPEAIEEPARETKPGAESVIMATPAFASIAPVAAPAMAAAAPAQPNDQPAIADPPRTAAGPQPAPAALAQAAPQAAFLRTAQPEHRAQPQAAPIAAPQVQSQPPAQTTSPPPPPVTQVRIEVTPAPAVMRPLAKDEVRPAPPVLSTQPDIQPSASTNTAPLAAPVTHPLASSAPASIDRPQDFSALIDRLVAAREAVAPQAVAISVPHADFGQIHLRFRHEEAGLAVSMASADPAFARTASAIPPVLPVGDAQTAQFQTGPRQDSAAASGQSGSGQQRQAPADRRDGQPHPNHTLRGARGDKPQQRAGIFA